MPFSRRRRLAATIDGSVTETYAPAGGRRWLCVCVGGCGRCVYGPDLDEGVLLVELVAPQGLFLGHDDALDIPRDALLAAALRQRILQGMGEYGGGAAVECKFHWGTGEQESGGGGRGSRGLR